MTFDNIILVLVGVGCAWYLASKVRKVMKGETGCSGCSGCPSAKNGCCGTQPPQQSGTKR
jgi:hypothetical protein